MQLEPAEVQCLRRIAQELHGELLPCASPVLQRLLSKGFVERQPRLHAPLEWSGAVYRITTAGERVLRQHSAQ
jgi:DNA-binding MarR family transcriptional regulator